MVIAAHALWAGVGLTLIARRRPIDRRTAAATVGMAMLPDVLHHLHCIMHSAIVAGAVTSSVWWRRRALWLPLLGWWSHIVIDVFTHSADFYAVPVLYPITERGFDGVAWNRPWFMALNYVALVAVGLWLYRTRRSAQTSLPRPKPSRIGSIR